uniref:Uncharacterized protein n=1 Tax=viral metagenome TaxID=1070528 RepID=A0A6C0CSB4_9ZZZZ
MDIIEEIKYIFDDLKNALSKTKENVKLLDESYEKIISLICKKNKNIYADLIQQMTPIPLFSTIEKSL